jgi:hypothetical protein
MGYNTSYNLSGALDTDIQRKFLVDKFKINTIKKGKQKFQYGEQLRTNGKKTKIKERRQVFICGTICC